MYPWGRSSGDERRGSRSSEREPRRRRAAADSESVRRACRALDRGAGRRCSRRGIPCAARCSSAPDSQTSSRSTASSSRVGRGRSSRSTPSVPAGARFRPLSGDGFVFNKDVGGGEWYQLFWRDERTGKVTMFTDGKSRNTGGDFSHSGKWLAYQSTRRNGKDNDIWVVDPADAKTERKVLEVSGGGWGGLRLVARRQDAPRGANTSP